MRLSENAANPPDHFLGGERLRDIAGRPDFAAAKDVGSEPPRGQHDDRQVLGLGVPAESGGEVESVGGCGQGDVQQHQIDLFVAEDFLGNFGRWCLKCDETLATKLERQTPSNRRLVVDDKYPAPHLRSLRR